MIRPTTTRLGIEKDDRDRFAEKAKQRRESRKKGHKMKLIVLKKIPPRVRNKMRVVGLLK